MTIDEKITRFIKFLFMLILGVVFLPILLALVIPTLESAVVIPSYMKISFVVSVIFFFIVALYKLIKGY